MTWGALDLGRQCLVFCTGTSSQAKKRCWHWKELQLCSSAKCEVKPWREGIAMMYDTAKSIQDNTLEVAKTTKVPENSPAASWACLLELKANRFYRPIKAGLCKGTIRLFFVMQQKFCFSFFSSHFPLSSNCSIYQVTLSFKQNSTNTFTVKHAI